MSLVVKKVVFIAACLLEQTEDYLSDWQQSDGLWLIPCQKSWSWEG